MPKRIMTETVKRRAVITLRDGGTAEINGMLRITARLPRGRGRKIEIEVEPIDGGLHLRRQPAAESTKTVDGYLCDDKLDVP